MVTSNMSIWAWTQPVDRIWKVISDPEKGTIVIYNEKDELISEQKNLEKDDILLIEEYFLKIVATKLTYKDSEICQKCDSCKEASIIDKHECNQHEYDSMYV